MNGFSIHLYVHWENLKLCSTDARETVWCLTQHWPLCMGENQVEEQRTSWQAQKKLCFGNNGHKVYRHLQMTNTLLHNLGPTLSGYSQTSFHPSSLKSSINNLNSKRISQPRPPFSTATHHAVSRIKTQLSSNTVWEHHWYYFVWEGLKGVWKCITFLYSFTLKVFYSSSSFMSIHKHSISYLQCVVLSHAHWAAICFSFQVNRHKSSLLFILRQYSRSWIYYHLFKCKFQQMSAYISCMSSFIFIV